MATSLTAECFDSESYGGTSFLLYGYKSSAVFTGESTMVRGDLTGEVFDG